MMHECKQRVAAHCVQDGSKIDSREIRINWSGPMTYCHLIGRLQTYAVTVLLRCFTYLLEFDVKLRFYTYYVLLSITVNMTKVVIKFHTVVQLQNPREMG